MAGDKLLQKFLLKLKTSNIQFSQIFWSKDFNFWFLIPHSWKLWPAMLPLSKPYSAGTFVAQEKLLSFKTFALSITNKQLVRSNFFTHWQVCLQLQNYHYISKIYCFIIASFFTCATTSSSRERMYINKQ